MPYVQATPKGNLLGAIGKYFRMVRQLDVKFSDTIVPTMDVKKLLVVTSMQFVSKAITATGLVTFFDVPKGKRWTLLDSFVQVASGTMTFNNVYISTTILNMPVSSFTGTTERLDDFPERPVLEEGWSFKVNVDTKAVNGNLYCYLLVEEEEVY